MPTVTLIPGDGIGPEVTDAAVKQIPVVILSAAPASTLDIGAEAVLMKPFDLDRLLNTVRAYC